jgi:hypothetical protein
MFPMMTSRCCNNERLVRALRWLLAIGNISGCSSPKPMMDEVEDTSPVAAPQDAGSEQQGETNGSAHSTRPQSLRLAPLLECIEPKAEGMLRAYWGYSNPTDSVVTRRLGSSNQFSPAPMDRGQPRTFEPGTHAGAFSVLFPVDEVLTWRLDGRSVSAQKSSRRCPANEAGSGAAGTDGGAAGANGCAMGAPAEGSDGAGGAPACSPVDPGSLAWARPLCSSIDDLTGRVFGQSVAALADGSAIVAGTFSGTVSFGSDDAAGLTLSSPSIDEPNGFVARYASEGAPQWVRHIRGATVLVNRVAMLADGSAIVTGVFGGHATFAAGTTDERTFAGRGNQSLSLFLVRYSSDGALLWATEAAGDNPASAQGLGLTALTDGAIAVTGGLSGAVTFGAGEPFETTLMNINSFEADAFVAVYTCAGALAWAKRIDTARDGFSRAAGESVAALPDGALAVTGVLRGRAVFGPGEPNETTLIGEGTFIAQYYADGRLIWARRAEAASGYGIAASVDGTTVVTGTFNSTATFGPGEPGETTLTAVGGDDGFVAQLAADGSLQWARKFGGTDSEYGAAVAMRADGTVVVTGRFSGPADFDSGGSAPFVLQGFGPGYDIYLAAYARNGTLAWAKAAGGNGSDGGGNLATTHDGAVLVIGEINQGLYPESAMFGIGEANETVIAGDNAFLAKYGACTR